MSCLIIDLAQFFLAGTLVIPLLTCFYCATIMKYSTYTLIKIVPILQCLETFCFYNFFLLATIEFIPITICAWFFKKHLYPSRWYGTLFALMSILIHLYLIECWFLHRLPINSYTIMRIGGMLFIEICFSLTINKWGTQDNRA
jgi:hypothetical protein